jgi:alpha-galactosidase
MTDPHAAATLPLDKIWAMCDELIEAHQKVGLLGGYAPTIRGTGRSYAGTGDKVIVSLEPAKALSEISGAPVEFVVTATNQGETVFIGKLILEANGAAVSAKGGALALKIGAGETVTKRVVLQPPAAGALTLRAVSADARVLSRDFTFNPTRIVRTSSTVPIPVEVRFMDNKLMTGLLTVEGGKLVLAGRVLDTAVKIAEKAPWTASAIELFVKQAKGAVGSRQYFLLPRTKGATVLGSDRRPAKEGAFKVEIDKGGYDFSLRFDLAKAGVQAKADDPFYLDMIVCAGALGDAHGACRVGWNGKTNSSSRSEHFPLIAPE